MKCLAMEIKIERRDELSRKVFALCDKALEGSLSLSELQRLWPPEASQDAFFAQIYSDLQDGVEHLPGFAFRSGIDWNAWQKSETHWLLYVDSLLLAYDSPTDELLRCYHAVVAQKPRDAATARTLVADRLAR